jgi:hypothetical protein
MDHLCARFCELGLRDERGPFHSVPTRHLTGRNDDRLGRLMENAAHNLRLELGDQLTVSGRDREDCL